jgi:cell wall-associated NlpC family hydrolase
MLRYHFNRAVRKIVAAIASSALVILLSASAQADTAAETEKITSLIEKECVQLSKDKMKALVLSRFSSEIEKGLSPELIKIMEGVVKRTDFDNIPEEKTVEIIGLVYESYKKGASLEYLDQIFDVAYAKTISVDNLTAAAKALKEFHHSDVPQDIAEEFVYHSLEEGWDPAAVPVLTRGLIYGVDRGLTPQRMALVIMLDTQQGVLKKKSADQLVLDAIKLVREKEPKNWKPMKKSERELAEKQEQKKKLESLQRQAEERRRQKEAERKAEEESFRRLYADKKGPERQLEQERIAKKFDAMLRATQEEIMKYENQQKELDAGLARHRQQLEQEKQERDQEREEQRQSQLARMQQSVASTGKTGRIDVLKLYAEVDRSIGIPYRFGGDSEAGIDCSAFTRRVYRANRVELPRTSVEQSYVGLGVNDAMMQPGDLVFFDPSIVGRISHVGVYLGNGVFAHASSSKGVTKSSIREKYYTKRFVKANRVFEM